MNIPDFDLCPLPQGFPSVTDYKRLVRTSLFLEMESFSNTFVRTQAKALRSCRWILDPFHQWSRQWEYPFAYSYIHRFLSRSNLARVSREIRILDAGSGCTFFPYYLTHRHPDCIIYCCDCDSSLASIFNEIGTETNANVKFDIYDLGSMGYEDESFELLYCISVLEHTSNCRDIIEEFHRVLKRNGLLVMTFDVSLDGKTEIPLHVAKDLLETLAGSFSSETPSPSRILMDLKNSDILTTKYVKTLDKRLLPWRSTLRSLLHQLRRFELPREPFFNLTVFCGVWQKKD